MIMNTNRFSRLARRCAASRSNSYPVAPYRIWPSARRSRASRPVPPPAELRPRAGPLLPDAAAGTLGRGRARRRRGLERALPVALEGAVAVDADHDRGHEQD